MDAETLARKGAEIYHKLLPSLVPQYKGEYIVIHVPSAEYWVEHTLLEAIQKARMKYVDNLFFSVRVGEEVIGSL